MLSTQIILGKHEHVPKKLKTYSKKPFEHIFNIHNFFPGPPLIQTCAYFKVFIFTETKLTFLQTYLKPKTFNKYISINFFF